MTYERIVETVFDGETKQLFLKYHLTRTGRYETVNCSVPKQEYLLKIMFTSFDDCTYKINIFLVFSLAHDRASLIKLDYVVLERLKHNVSLLC